MSEQTDTLKRDREAPLRAVSLGWKGPEPHSSTAEPSSAKLQAADILSKRVGGHLVYLLSLLVMKSHINTASSIPAVAFHLCMLPEGNLCTMTPSFSKTAVTPKTTGWPWLSERGPRHPDNTRWCWCKLAQASSTAWPPRACFHPQSHHPCRSRARHLLTVARCRTVAQERDHSRSKMLDKPVSSIC